MIHQYLYLCTFITNCVVFLKCYLYLPLSQSRELLECGKEHENNNHSIYGDSVSTTHLGYIVFVIPLCMS